MVHQDQAIVGAASPRLASTHYGDTALKGKEVIEIMNKSSQNFGRLVLFCIEADFYK